MRAKPRAQRERPAAGIRRRCAWCSSVAAIARSTCPSAGSGASGASSSGAPERLGHEAVGLLAERERAGLARAAHDAAGRAGEADQVLALAADAHAPSCGARPAASSSFRRNASAPARPLAQRSRRPPACSSSSDSWRHSRLNTPGCGSAVSNSRPTASHARAAASSARASPRRRAWPSTVCAPVTVSSSPRPSCSSMLQPEERLQAPAEAAARAAHALGDRAHPPARRRVQVQDAIGLAVAHRAQHDRLGLDRSGHPACESRLARGGRATRRRRSTSTPQSQSLYFMK